MADISLREYLAKLDTLLNSGSAAEVILHCRHILQYFPKNAQTYRLLGRALVATSRWPEAGEVMRRVLGVFPDDKDAHAGLSEVYRIEKRPDDAIWHLERAFEQAPNDQGILENLRELYRKYHKVEHGKVQLTTAAVARQYIRNGLYEQAIGTLQKARAASPERVDLPLLLAQTYWDRGQRIEAAQTAMEILKVLPDCLVANSLLAALWLTEARPSDAQRYIGRIESLDPYLALELAQGEDVPDTAFKLEELDYQLAAEREISNQTPDWLSDFTGAAEAMGTGDEQFLPDDDDIVAAGDFRSALSGVDQDTSDEDLSDLFSEAPTIPKATGGLSGRFNKPQTDGLSTGNTASKPAIPGPRRGLTGRLTPTPEQTPPPEALPSFFDDIVEPASNEYPQEVTANLFTSDLPDLASLVPSDEQATPEPQEDLPFRRERVIPQAEVEDDNDPLAWLRSSGVEINEEAPVRQDNDLFDAESDNLALQEADAADPLAWLQDYGGKNMIVESENDQSESPLAVDDDFPTDEDDDPLAWLKPSTETAPKTTAEQEPLDWLSDDSLLDEAFNLESLVNNQSPMSEQPPVMTAVSPTANTPEWQDTMADEKNPLDWLSSEPESDANDTDFTWMQNNDPTSVNQAEDFPDWLNQPDPSEAVGSGLEDNMAWMSELPDLVQPEPSEPPKPTNTGMLDWLGKQTSTTSELPVPAQSDSSAPDWLNEFPSEPQSASSKIVDENGFEWMSTADELPPISGTSDMPDWLTSAENTVEPEVELFGSADVPNWIANIDTPAEPEPNTLNWLETVQPDTTLPEPELVADIPDWLSGVDNDSESLPGGGTPDWLSAIEPQAEPLAAADTPDWLSAMEPIADEEPEAEPLATADTPDWLSAMEPIADEEPEAEPLAAADTPDWLSAMEPIADEEPQAEPLATADTPDWLSAMEPIADEEPEAEPLAAVDTPDWLSAMEPVADEEPEAEPLAAADTPDWLSAMEPIADEEPEAEPLAAADTPDWLTAMEPIADEEPEAEPLATADTPDWLSAMEPIADEEPEAEPLATADTPDWLSAMEPIADEEPEAEPLAAADTPDWLSAMEPIADEEPQAEPLATADTPDWLSAMEPIADEEPQAEPLATADTPDWLSAMEPVADEEPEAEPLAAADTPDWLSAMEPIADEEPEAEPLAAADTPDWLSAMEPIADEEPEAEPLATADTPDWLSAMEPIADEEPEAEPLAAADTPDWLSAMEPIADEEPQAEPLATADTPDWLSAMEPVADEEPEAEPLAAADTPDWLTAMQPEDDEPEPLEEPFGVADTPDWLAAMQPDDDEFEPIDEPVVSSESPDWISTIGTNNPAPTVSEVEPVAADVPDWLASVQPEDEVQPEAVTEIQDDTPEWLLAMQSAPQTPAQPETELTSPDWEPASDEDIARVAHDQVPEWLNEMPVQAEPEDDQQLTEDEWNEADELEPEADSGVPDWLSGIQGKQAGAEQPAETYAWEDDGVLEESMPAAPAPASNAPDWLNAMVPGLDVDYDAPEDEPVETEFLTGRKEVPAAEKAAKDAKVKPEFGWLLDIVSEESQQVTVVADKTALRRFVFSRLPVWLRKPTEQPDKSADNGDSEADNVDIPPWLQ